MTDVLTIVAAVLVAVALIGAIAFAIGRRSPSEPTRGPHTYDSGYGDGPSPNGIEFGSADGGGD